MNLKCKVVVVRIVVCSMSLFLLCHPLNRKSFAYEAPSVSDNSASLQKLMVAFALGNLVCYAAAQGGLGGGPGGGLGGGGGVPATEALLTSGNQPRTGPSIYGFLHPVSHNKTADIDLNTVDGLMQKLEPDLARSPAPGFPTYKEMAERVGVVGCPRSSDLAKLFSDWASNTLLRQALWKFTGASTLSLSGLTTASIFDFISFAQTNANNVLPLGTGIGALLQAAGAGNSLAGYIEQFFATDARVGPAAMELYRNLKVYHDCHSNMTEYIDNYQQWINWQAKLDNVQSNQVQNVVREPQTRTQVEAPAGGAQPIVVVCDSDKRIKDLGIDGPWVMISTFAYQNGVRTEWYSAQFCDEKVVMRNVTDIRPTSNTPDVKAYHSDESHTYNFQNLYTKVESQGDSSLDHYIVAFPVPNYSPDYEVFSGPITVEATGVGITKVSNLKGEPYKNGWYRLDLHKITFPWSNKTYLINNYNPNLFFHH